ncbi:hypothetical protein D3C79_985170 [compost metagenome]
MQASVQHHLWGVAHRHLESVAQVSLAIAINRNVCCEYQRGVTGVQGFEHHPLRDLSVDHIELER